MFALTYYNVIIVAEKRARVKKKSKKSKSIKKNKGIIKVKKKQVIKYYWNKKPCSK